MINRREYMYELIKNDEVINELKWSMAGGGVRILTDIKNSVGVGLLMERFILDCEAEKRTILPLALEAQEYFNQNKEKQSVLKELDISFIQQNWQN